jgi:hypothetical protein
VGNVTGFKLNDCKKRIKGEEMMEEDREFVRIKRRNNDE